MIYCELLELLNKYFHSDISFLSGSTAPQLTADFSSLSSPVSLPARPAAQLLLNFTFKFQLRGSNGKTLSYSLGMQIFHKQPIENNTQLKVWGHSLNLNNVEIFIYNNNVVVMRLFNFHVADIEYCEYYWNF